MNETIWTAVDDYIGGKLIPPDPALQTALESSAAGGLPEIQVSAPLGRFLQLQVRICGARRVLELGTLGGYSTIWLARGLTADGQLISVESERRHAEVAKANLARAGLASRVQVRVGPGLQVLPELERESAGPFDLIFIDADKENYPGYFQWALRLARPGTVIIADNVVRQGAIIESGHADPRVRAVRELYEQMAAEPRVSATVLQTVGAKGYDGFVLAVVE